MPLTVARHCSMVEKPQFRPPPFSPPPYSAHQGYSISARAGVADIDAMTARMKNANVDFCMTYAPVGDLGYNNPRRLPISSHSRQKQALATSNAHP